jgi:hypothetical protein
MVEELEEEVDSKSTELGELIERAKRAADEARKTRERFGQIERWVLGSLNIQERTPWRDSLD